MNVRNYLKNVSRHCRGDYYAIAKHVAGMLAVPDYNDPSRCICIGDPLYPSCFYDLENPPFVLYYEGDITLLHQSIVGVIGSRKPSGYALEMTKKLVRSLRNKHTIVSGLAYGIDGCAHHHALPGSTLAILGCGVDVYYPKKHTQLQEQLKKEHLVISEYPAGVGPQRHHFPFRNRLIAALSAQLYVMSAAYKSGTMKTVEHALKLDRPVICLPHNIDDPSGHGCNLLISEGAGLLTNAEELSNI